jgi:hypothetical protein
MLRNREPLSYNSNEKSIFEITILALALGDLRRAIENSATAAGNMAEIRTSPRICYTSLPWTVSFTAETTQGRVKI